MKLVEIICQLQGIGTPRVKASEVALLFAVYLTNLLNFIINN